MTRGRGAQRPFGTVTQPGCSSLARLAGSSLICESLPDPLRTSPEINNRPNHRTLMLDRVKDPVRKNPAQEAIVVAVNHSMDSCGYFQALDIRPKASRKVLAKPGLLCLIKEVSIIQVFQSILGDQDISHRLPMVPLTESQSSRCALPSPTRARRWSRSSFCSWGISMRSKRSRKSSQIASIIRIFSSIGNAFTSCDVMVPLYGAPDGQATTFLERTLELTGWVPNQIGKKEEIIFCLLTGAALVPRLTLAIAASSLQDFGLARVPRTVCDLRFFLVAPAPALGLSYGIAGCRARELAIPPRRFKAMQYAFTLPFEFVWMASV